MQSGISDVSASHTVWHCAFCCGAAGWEDGLYHRSQAARMAMPTSRNGHPHTYSVRPMSVEAKANAAAGASNNV